MAVALLDFGKLYICRFRYLSVVHMVEGCVGVEPFAEADGGQSEFHGEKWELREWSAWVAAALAVFVQV